MCRLLTCATSTPPMDAFYTELKSKDRLVAIELKYVNPDGAFLKLGVSAQDIALSDEATSEDIARRLKIAQTRMNESMEMLSLRQMYFCNVSDQGVGIMREMMFLVEQGRDLVLSESHKTERELLTLKLEVG